jgi:glycosyltransferase involved in cell wall biosynthesis
VTADVRPLVFLPADLAGSKIGGIQSFVHGFIKFAPPDFHLECVGTTADPDARPVGRWTEVEVGGRRVRYLAVTKTEPGDPRRRIPVALSYAAGLLRHRGRIPTAGRILNYHRAGAPLVHRGARAPRVQFVHLNVAEIDRGGGESRWRMLPGAYHRFEDLTITRMDRVFVVNERGVDFYRRRHPEIADRFQFLPTWYDDTIFVAADAAERRIARAEISTEVGIDSGSRVLLFVGRLEAQKDPGLLLETFARARDAQSALTLIIVGSGGLEPWARQRAEQLGIAASVRFLGSLPRPRVARLMLAADVLLLASRFEGMPITAIEALASGLPVVAPDVGELPRLVDNGRTGWLVKERTPAALAAGVGQALGLPVEETVVACRALAARYRARVVLAPVYELHRELATASRSRGR